MSRGQPSCLVLADDEGRPDYLLHGRPQAQDGAPSPADRRRQRVHDRRGRAGTRRATSSPPRSAWSSPTRHHRVDGPLRRRRDRVARRLPRRRRGPGARALDRLPRRRVRRGASSGRPRRCTPATRVDRGGRGHAPAAAAGGAPPRPQPPARHHATATSPSCAPARRGSSRGHRRLRRAGQPASGSPRSSSSTTSRLFAGNVAHVKAVKLRFPDRRDDLAKRLLHTLRLDLPRPGAGRARAHAPHPRAERRGEPAPPPPCSGSTGAPSVPRTSPCPTPTSSPSGSSSAATSSPRAARARSGIVSFLAASRWRKEDHAKLEKRWLGFQKKYTSERFRALPSFPLLSLPLKEGDLLEYLQDPSNTGYPLGGALAIEMAELLFKRTAGNYEETREAHRRGRRHRVAAHPPAQAQVRGRRASFERRLEVLTWPSTASIWSTRRTAAETAWRGARPSRSGASRAALGDHRAAAAHFQPGEELVTAANVALAVGAPLLLTGEPGTGKTQVAHYFAWYFGIEETLFQLHVRSTTTASDLLYRFDLRWATSTPRATPPARVSRSTAPPSSTRARSGAPTRPTPLRIVLIDEIDKAPRDFPNDLLHVLDQHSFDVPEVARTIAGRREGARARRLRRHHQQQRAAPPGALPAPLRLPFPHPLHSSATPLLRNAVEARAGDFPNLDVETRKAAIERFLRELRGRDLRKPPATARASGVARRAQRPRRPNAREGLRRGQARRGSPPSLGPRKRPRRPRPAMSPSDAGLGSLLAALRSAGCPGRRRRDPEASRGCSPWSPTWTGNASAGWSPAWWPSRSSRRRRSTGCSMPGSKEAERVVVKGSHGAANDPAAAARGRYGRSGSDGSRP